MCSLRKQRPPHCAIGPVCSTGKINGAIWPRKAVGGQRARYDVNSVRKWAGALPTQSIDSICGTARAKLLRLMAQLESLRSKMCPPGQGMSGRVYQIDAGWMGGAASIGY